MTPTAGTAPHRSTVPRLAASRSTLSDRGSSALELTVLAPILLAFILVTIFGGRVALAHQATQAAATDAARAASISRTQQAAAGLARTTATTTLDQEGLRCTTTAVTLDTSAFSAPAGTPANITATVTCQVQLSDLVLPGIPGSRTVTSTVSSPLDTYRARTA